jgi:hypothetical protein
MDRPQEIEHLLPTRAQSCHHGNLSRNQPVSTGSSIRIARDSRPVCCSSGPLQIILAPTGEFSRTAARQIHGPLSDGSNG